MIIYTQEEINTIIDSKPQLNANQYLVQQGYNGLSVQIINPHLEIIEMFYTGYFTNCQTSILWAYSVEDAVNRHRKHWDSL